MSNIQEKMEKLKNDFVDGDDSAKSEIAMWDRELRKLNLIDELGQTDAIKMLLNKFVDQIVEINSILVNKVDLKSRDRAILMLEKEIRMDFVGVFKDAKQTIKEIELRIDEQLE